MPRATAIAPPRSGAKMLAALTRVVSMDVKVTPCGRGIRFINSSKRDRSTPALKMAAIAARAATTTKFSDSDRAAG